MILQLNENDLIFSKFPKHKNFNDISDKKFNRLKVLGFKGFENKNAVWYLKCDCGNIIKLVSYEVSRKRRATKSCGCLNRELASKRLKKHGLLIPGKRVREAMIHGSMMSRCYNSKIKEFKYYGAKGVKVCQRWRIDTYGCINFINDLGNRPTNKHSIDRIDVEGNYSCGKCEECVENGWKMNCRWATIKEQNRNKRTNVKITYNNETKCLAEWAEILNVGAETLLSRLKKNNFCIHKALEKPILKKNIKISFAGDLDTLIGWAGRLNVNPKTLRRRLKNKTIEEAFMLL